MEITLEAFEGGFYLAFEHIDGKKRLVRGNLDRPKRFENLCQAREFFQHSVHNTGAGSINGWLVMHSSYDEMVGTAPSDDLDMKIPFNW